MSGYGNPDEESECAMALVETGIAVARMMIRHGPASKICLDCGEPIPENRRLASPGCRYCIACQVFHDRLPRVNLVTKML
jgi:phage/conjugal plasmid C-4 type zinc finger TraR family protein